jgi:hypothetical protein
MYFHPLILTEAQNQQRLAASQELMRIYLDCIDRQHRLHTDAVSELSARQKKNLYALAEAIDGTRPMVRCTFRVAPTPLELLRVSMRWGEIASDALRQVGLLVDRHAKEMSARVLEDKDACDTSPGPDSSRRRKSRRLQVMA